MTPARRFITFNIRTIILLFVLIVFTFGNIFAHLIIKNTLISSLDKELEKSNKSQAEVVISQFNSEIEKHFSDLTNLQNYFINNSTAGEENIKNYAQGQITSKSVFNQIGIVDINLQPIAVSDSSIPNKNFIKDFSNLPEVQEAIKSNYIYKEEFVAGPIELVGKRTLFILFKPIEINGAFFGLSFGVVDINRLNRNVFSSSSSEKFNISVEVNNHTLLPYDAGVIQKEHEIDLRSEFGKIVFDTKFYPKNFITESGQIAIQIIYASIISIQTLAVAILMIFMSQTHELEKKVAKRTLEILEKSKQIAVEEEKIKKIINNTPVGIIAIRISDLKPIFFNQKISDFFGSDLDNVLTINEIVSRVNPQSNNSERYDLRSLPYNQTLISHKPESIENLVIEISGNKKQVKMVSIPIRHEDGQDEILIVITDLSEEAKLAESLKKVNIELISMDKQKDEFLSVASHELRTPMTTIKGYVDMILNGDAGEINTEIKQYLSEVYKSINRLTALVNNILTVSKLQNRALQFDLKSFDLVNFISENMSNWKVLASTKSLNLIFHQPASPVPEILSDPGKLIEIMNNFISNAVKYSEKGDISIFIKNDADYVYVSIQDMGIGIEESEMQKIFQRFYRVDNTRSRNQEGSGLGLYIAKDLVEKMHGRVYVHSQINVGSTFSFSVPIAKKDKTPLIRDTKFTS